MYIDSLAKTFISEVYYKLYIYYIIIFKLFVHLKTTTFEFILLAG